MRGGLVLEHRSMLWFTGGSKGRARSREGEGHDAMQELETRHGVGSAGAPTTVTVGMQRTK